MMRSLGNISKKPDKTAAAVLGLILAVMLSVQPLYAGSSSLSHAGYELEKAVILSRHNIRSPLSGHDSLLGRITPHKWYEWTSGPSELSLKGGLLETLMGNYFRKWLEEEKLFPDNYRPDGEQVRLYSNSKQRTIATAKCFAAGFLPVADTDIEYHMEFDEMDPVFTPQLTFVCDEYKADAENQIRELFSDKINDLRDNYDLICDVIDIQDSEAWREGEVSAFVTDDLSLKLEENEEPGMTGTLKTACSVSDALILQYYEETDDEKAAFGHKLSPEQWEKIAQVKDVYGDVLFTAPLICVNAAHPLLEEISSEMKADGRKAAYLCGHDSNIGSVLAALEAQEYDLPETVEKKTPIGCKLVFAQWKNSAGEQFYSVDLVYQSTGQLRSLTILDLRHPPVVYPVTLKGVDRNEDGLYPAQALYDRFDKAISAYDRIVEEYSADLAA